MNEDIAGAGKLVESIEKGTKEFRQLVYGFLYPIVQESGEYFADKIRFARITNVNTMLKRSIEILEAKGIEPNPVALKTMLPLIEGCSLEEKTELVETWALLLASAAAGNSLVTSYAHILIELTPQDARILSAISDRNDYQIQTAGFIAIGASVEKIVNETDVDNPEIVIILGNLNRLGLIYSVAGDNRLFYSQTPIAATPEEYVGLTPLGKGFIEACKGPK